MESYPASVAIKIFGELCERAAAGERIMLTRYGRPYVVLVPPTQDDREQAGKDVPTP